VQGVGSGSYSGVAGFGGPDAGNDAAPCRWMINDRFAKIRWGLHI
jgi:hypothetical protein